MKSLRICVKTSIFSLGKVSVACLSKCQSFEKMQKKDCIPGFLRMKGRSKTKFERGKTISQCPGAQTKRSKTKQSKAKFQFSQMKKHMIFDMKLQKT